MKRQSYPSDVTDAQWALLEPLLPVPDPEGRPWEMERREIVKAIF
jgi:transposase